MKKTSDNNNKNNNKHICGHKIYIKLLNAQISEICKSCEGSVGDGGDLVELGAKDLQDRHSAQHPFSQGSQFVGVNVPAWGNNN